MGLHIFVLNYAPCKLHEEIRQISLLLLKATMVTFINKVVISVQRSPHTVPVIFV